MTRHVALGGEFKSRGLLSGRSLPEKLLLFIGLALSAFLVMLGSFSFFFLVAALFVAVASILTTMPTAINEGRSLAAIHAERAYRLWQKTTGTDVFDPVHEQIAAERLRTYQQATRSKQKTPRKQRTQNKQKTPNQQETIRPKGFAVRRAQRRKATDQPAPLMIGKMSATEVPFNTRERLTVFRHANTAPVFYTAIFEVRGSTGGVVEEDIEDIPFIGFGKVLARAARRTSAISHIQSFTRSVPLDITDHISWLSDYVHPQAHDHLVRSYQELCLDVEQKAEQHRSYWVLRFDNLAALQRAITAQTPGPRAVYDAIVSEAHALMSQAVTHKAIRSFRPVNSNMAAALLSHLQDPYEVSIDDPDQNIGSVWQRLDATKTSKAVLVNNHAYTRVAYIPRHGFMAGSALPVQSMRQLVNGIVPAVIHSVSWVNEVVDARTARAQAVSDRTSDKAKRKSDAEKGKISDGTEHVMSSSSDQRGADLMPGSGHHGVKWGAYLSFTVQSEEELLAVSTQIESVATDCGIERLIWLDDRHHMALASVMPLGRGIR